MKRKIGLEGYAEWEKLTMERKESLAIAASTNESLLPPIEQFSLKRGTATCHIP